MEGGQSLTIGTLVTCRVEKITSYGAWVSIPGVGYPGLVLLHELSWGRVKHPADIINADDSYDLIVLRDDAENRRVILSLKHLQPDPWRVLSERLHPGERFPGVVVISITDYGAFVELSQHVEALLYIDDLKKRYPGIKHPSEVLHVGDLIDVVVLTVDMEERRAKVALADGSRS